MIWREIHSAVGFVVTPERYPQSTPVAQNHKAIEQPERNRRQQSRRRPSCVRACARGRGRARPAVATRGEGIGLGEFLEEFRLLRAAALHAVRGSVRAAAGADAAHRRADGSSRQRPGISGLPGRISGPSGRRAIRNDFARNFPLGSVASRQR
jgi:hypothetical protein